MAVEQAARDNGVFLMKGFMYKCLPVMSKLKELLACCAIGKVVMINVKFGVQQAFAVEKI